MTNLGSNVFQWQQFVILLTLALAVYVSSRSVPSDSDCTDSEVSTVSPSDIVHVIQTSELKSRSCFHHIGMTRDESNNGSRSVTVFA